jgi:hypothetical protein
MAINNVQLIACQTHASYANYWSYWAGLTGGKSYNTNSSNMAVEVVDAVKTSLSAPIINDLKLVPSVGFDAWIKSITPSSYTGPTDLVIPFTIDIKVPVGTADGLYNYKLEAMDAAGVKYGTYEFNIQVVSGQLSPATTITTDKFEYTSNENVGITITAKNLTNSNENFIGNRPNYSFCSSVYNTNPCSNI